MYLVSRCKFEKCAYQHERNRNFRKYVGVPNYKIKKIKELIKDKEAEEVEQVKMVNDLQRGEGKQLLDNKVASLEKFVVIWKKS